MADLSIIIISYNSKDISKKCLDTIVESLNYDKKLKAEIIVVDNASTDGSVEMLKKYQKELEKVSRVELKNIFCQENLGFGKGNNLAAKKTKGKILLFLNSDIEVIDDAIVNLFQYFTSAKSKFDFVGAKLLNKNLTPQPSSGPFYSLPVVFGALFLRGDYWGLTRYSPEKLKEVDWVSGACFITKAEDFKKVGGFDEKIFMYMEEIDLFYRAKKKGFRVGFYPKAKFIHLGGGSSKGRSQPILQVYRGFLYFYNKHHSKLKTELVRFLLKLKAVVAFLIGKIINNQYLIETYGKAYQIAKSN